LADRFAYITDPKVRGTAKELLDEVVSWDKGKILVEPIKYAISLKVSGRVFAYITPRRKHFIVEAYNEDGKWTGYPIHTAEELEVAKELVRRNFDRLHQ
jgi:hypothetical protein